MIPYSKQSINNTDIRAVHKVLKSDFLTQGPISKIFEKKLCKIVGAKSATTFNSATSALHISCLALGVGKGDIVWTCTNSFVASANCAEYCGAKVDLVDINIENFNISITDLKAKLKKAKKIKKLPKVVIPVHFTGLPCDMKNIYKLSKRYRFKIIEDASHAIGAKYLNQNIGNCKYSNITVFSFHPVKIITTAEGGAALTNNENLDNKLKILRTHGIVRDKKYLKTKINKGWYYEFQKLGYNYRLNEIQSALGLSQLKRLKKWVTYRNKLASIYRRELKDLPIIMPKIEKEYYSSYHLFVIRLKKNKKKISRDQIYEILKKKGIMTNVHYIPIHTQPYYKQKGFKNSNFPKAMEYFKTCLSLPMYVGLTKSKQAKVIKNLRNILL